MAVLMDESEYVAQSTPGTSSGIDSATIPPVLTDNTIQVFGIIIYRSNDKNNVK